MNRRAPEPVWTVRSSSGDDLTLNLYHARPFHGKFLPAAAEIHSDRRFRAECTLYDHHPPKNPASLSLIVAANTITGPEVEAIAAWAFLTLGKLCANDSISFPQAGDLLHELDSNIARYHELSHEPYTFSDGDILSRGPDFAIKLIKLINTRSIGRGAAVQITCSSASTVVAYMQIHVLLHTGNRLSPCSLDNPVSMCHLGHYIMAEAGPFHTPRSG